MKAIILAAGRGSRMKHLTDERPKCLIEFNGKPLLEWQLEAIYKAGIDEIGIVTGYKREMLTGYGLVEFHNPEWATTQMVSSLCCANEWLEANTCIVSYSDIFYEASAVRSLIESKADISLTYDPNWLELWTKRFGDPLLDAETFRLNSDGTLAEIGKKPKNSEEIEGQYMGLLQFTPAGWEEFLMNSINNEIKKIINQLDMTKAIQRVIDKDNIKVKVIPYIEKWGEIDTESDVYSYEEMINKK